MDATVFFFVFFFVLFCFCPRQESQQSTSALLIGTAENQGQLAGNQPPMSNPTYISQLKQHLTEQSVEIIRFKPKFRDSLDNLHQLISVSLTHPYSFYIIVAQLMPEDWSIATRVVYGEEYEDLITLDSIVTK